MKLPARIGSTWKRLALVAVVLVAVLTGARAATPATDGAYIVVLRDGVDVTQVAQQHAGLGARISFLYRYALSGYAARLSPTALARIERDPRVRFVSPDLPVAALGQTIPTGVRRIGAQAIKSTSTTTLGLARVGVAVIDSGIDLDHPDLGYVVPARNCVGYNPLPDDEYGHGTHVAGTIGALDDNKGVRGVAPGVRLYAVKVLDAQGTGWWSNVICGIDWVTANAAHVQVANMSLGGTGTATPSDAACLNSNNDALHMAICRSVKAGVTYVAAAGNNGGSADNMVPAAYDEVITVSALADSDGKSGGKGPPPSCYPGQTDDALATFSNYGPAVDIAAPGVCILSTALGGGYAVMSGTSMAAPHVSGAAALYLSRYPARTPGQVKAGLIAIEEPGPIPGDPDVMKEGVVRVASLANVNLTVP